MAIPLVSLQYNYFHIEVDCRPIQELFVVRDVNDPKLLLDNTVPYIAPYIRANQNENIFQFYRFLHPPPSETLLGTNVDNYAIQKSDWYADMYLLSTYAFLSEQEVRVFAAQPQTYLIKEVHEEIFHNISSTQVAKLNSTGLVVSWMWFFQRSDIQLRNEWSNYTNWPHKDLPFPVSDLSANPDLKITGKYHPENQRDIMINWGLLFDGKIRENTLDAGVLNLVEKYVRTGGYSNTGLYCYNFCLNTDPFQFQPSGAVNLSKFNQIEFEFTTITPVKDISAQTFVVCDGEGTPIGINKPVWKIYDYSYDLHVMEERYNILSFESGNAGLKFSR